MTLGTQAMSRGDLAPALDDILLDIATVIELTENDRKVAENRYRRLKTHLERPTSAIRPYLMSSASLIYPQGSVAIGTAIISGTDEERYDLDAIVEFSMPTAWTPDEALDVLAESLEGFPGVSEIVRCTRCVQLRFPFMHLDVALLDPAQEPRLPRVGEIFHAPEEGSSGKVPSNPYGFAQWFRGQMPANKRFVERLQERRRHVQANRFAIRAAEQDDLPSLIPPHLDTQRVVALKLLKRYVKLRYEGRELKLPAMVYPTLFAGLAPELDAGLCAQLELLAEELERDLRVHIAAGTRPDHRNPTWRPDRLNDRWPANALEMTVFANDLHLLRQKLARAHQAEFAEIKAIFAELFGERVTKRSFTAYLERAGLGDASRTRYAAGSGAILGASAVVAPSVARATHAVRPHTFHAGFIKKK